MEPMKPEVKKAILESNPQAQPSDIEEYERLLSARFTVDPDAAPSAAPQAASVDSLESRLERLHAKLFPAAARNRNAEQ